MSGADVAGLGAIAFLVALAAVAGAVETVLLRFGMVRALRLAEEERRGATSLLWLLEHRSKALNTVLLVTMTARIAATAVLVAFVVRRLPGAPGVAVAAVVMVLLSFVLAEVAPRTLALRSLEGTGLRLSAPFAVLTRLLTPLTQGLVALGRTLVRTHDDVSGPYPPDEELRELLAEEHDEELEEDERAMIHSIIELGDTIAREIMVPRPDMVTVDGEASLGEIVDAIVKHGFSRIPVHRGSKDEVVGVVYAKDVLERLAHDPEGGGWGDLVRPATFVPETKRVDDLLRELQEQTVHLAIVVDEYGAITGLVTIEDILEEIVGEIVDEHDHEEPLVEEVDDRRLRVDARLPVDELNELLGTELPHEGWDTVGGLMFGTLGRVPRPGERVSINGVTLVAERVQGRRISKVLVERGSKIEQTTEAIG